MKEKYMTVPVRLVTVVKHNTNATYDVSIFYWNPSGNIIGGCLLHNDRRIDTPIVGGFNAVFLKLAEGDTYEYHGIGSVASYPAISDIVTYTGRYAASSGAITVVDEINVVATITDDPTTLVDLVYP
jgi:hypothetical protein